MDEKGHAMNGRAAFAVIGGISLLLGGCVTAPPPAPEAPPEQPPQAVTEKPSAPPVDPAAYSALSKNKAQAQGAVDPAAYSALSGKGAPVDPAAYSALSKNKAQAQGAVDPASFSALSKRTAPAAAPQANASWSYAGANAPPQWGGLENGFSACDGRAQSPVELGAPVVQPQEALRFRYRVAKVVHARLQNLPRLTLVNGGGLELKGEFYALTELHLHVPAEHVVPGAPPAALEAQLIHRAASGRLLGVAVLMDERAEENVTLHRILNAIPGATSVPLPGLSMFNPANLLPGSARYATYSGSLTTPPCTEGVTWVVMQERGEISTEQLSGLRQRFPKSARPIQPLNERKIFSDG